MIKKQVNSNRNEKVASKVQTLVAEILQRDFSDDDLIRGVSLVGAQAHGGTQFVKLFFYAHENMEATQKRLDEITKTVRFALAQKMNQKYVPEIRFVYDDTLERADRIESLLNNLEM
jgi:ribosome-binding factor A